MTPFANRRGVANLAYWVTGTEGSNPSLSAKLLNFLALSIVVKPLSKRSDWRGWGQGGSGRYEALANLGHNTSVTQLTFVSRIPKRLAGLEKNVAAG